MDTVDAADSVDEEGTKKSGSADLVHSAHSGHPVHVPREPSGCMARGREKKDHEMVAEMVDTFTRV
jgi:hypothetical protein